MTVSASARLFLVRMDRFPPRSAPRCRRHGCADKAHEEAIIAAVQATADQIAVDLKKA